jgi:hypothetical protein
MVNLQHKRQAEAGLQPSAFSVSTVSPQKVPDRPSADQRANRILPRLDPSGRHLAGGRLGSAGLSLSSAQRPLDRRKVDPLAMPSFLSLFFPSLFR